jgi:hypothetical protein
MTTQFKKIAHDVLPWMPAVRRTFLGRVRCPGVGTVEISLGGLSRPVYGCRSVMRGGIDLCTAASPLPGSALMKPVVENLTLDDMLALAAYPASLPVQRRFKKVMRRGVRKGAHRSSRPPPV